MQYIGIEKYIFSDIYSFFLKYKDMDNTDSNWELCISEAKYLREKYEDHPLACKMIIAVMEQLEHIVSLKVGGEYKGLNRVQWEQKLEKKKLKNF